MTFETVAVDTPATRATSCIVGTLLTVICSRFLRAFLDRKIEDFGLLDFGLIAAGLAVDCRGVCARFADRDLERRVLPIRDAIIAISLTAKECPKCAERRIEVPFSGQTCRVWSIQANRSRGEGLARIDRDRPQ